MTSRPTVVFGDDGTPAADVAWLWINSQRWPGWRLEVVSARPPEAGPPLVRERAQLHPWDPPHLRPLFAEAEFAETEHLTAEADPRLVLSRASDLLVIGPRGPGLLKSLHLGSTADWLLSHPPAPMVIVRHGCAVRSVVLCVDGSIHAERATDALADLPWAGQLDITVLAVDDRRCDVEAATAAATERLDRVGARITSSIVRGQPTPSILSYLEDATPDLVALGTRGLTGLRRLRVGSTAAAVARAATCSALVACVDDAEIMGDAPAGISVG
jgi:nucleotide-binding universal stress UspA family protein